jgi:hypothetical protein
MRTREIKSTAWRALCTRINNQLHDSLVTIDTLDASGGKTEVADSLPLQKFDFETSDACNDTISICLRAASGKAIDHRVTEPIHLKLGRTEDGHAYNPVYIQAENGVTILNFRPAIPADLVAGLEAR